MAIKTVAVAGATGSIGAHVIKHLSASGFTVTALKRPEGKSPEAIEGVHKVVTVDYQDLTALTKALHGQDAVVSALGTFASQDTLMEASVAAGVKRFIPSEFGLDYSHPRISELPIFVPKLAYRKRLVKLAKENPPFSWTIISTSMFLEWSIENNFIIDASTEGGPIELWDGGDPLTSATTYDGIGRSVAGVLEQEEATKNRLVRVSQAEISQNKVLAIVSKHRPAIVKRGVVNVDSEDAYHEAVTAILSGKIDSTYSLVLPLAKRAVAVNIGAVLEHVDNDLVGVRRLTEDQIEKLIAESLA